jgi:hypothetical protein
MRPRPWPPCWRELLNGGSSETIVATVHSNAEAERLRKIVNAFSGVTITVVGDLVAD